MIISSPSSGSESKPRISRASSGVLIDLLFNPEDEGGMFRNVGPSPSYPTSPRGVRKHKATSSGVDSE
jgi:hypothetical protein